MTSAGLPVPPADTPSADTPSADTPSGPSASSSAPSAPNAPSAPSVPDAATWDELPDGVVVTDDAGLVTVFNRAAARVTGCDPRDVLGKHLRDALPLEDRQGRAWWVCVDPLGGLSTRTRTPETGLHLPGGQEVLATASFVRAGGPGGPVTRVVICIRDATTRRRAERRNADLISTVAHELRSPLTSVKGFTATLLAKWERFTDEQKQLMLETVNADADRVTRLIGELLDISRIDSGRLEVHRELVDLPACVRRAIDGLVASGQPADRFVVEAPPELPETWADADKIDQVLANLLENAVRHGAGTVTVTLEPDQAGRATVLTVADEGEGIPPELARRVFTRFWRGDRRGGTGLGLYIVKGLVEAHGGTVALDSAADGDGRTGARFRLVLPAGTPEFAL